MKPYAKLASGLVMVGASLLMLERYGLTQLRDTNLHVAGWLLSAVILAPLALIVAGGLTFVVGRMRGL